ncbi:alpha/beta fold hydrolase [Nocardioides sp. LHG3406-4]|uniref:alpha/beta fold hydrolase n=1 Tax=Nocardioides sp. LHG3406-4 TaxID=2804575 RepID=UPI003CFB0B16
MRTATIGGVTTSFEDKGSGPVVVLLHGSGPGVSAMANWSATVPSLVDRGFRVLAPDVIGFGQSDKPDDFPYGAEGWARAVRDLLAELEIPTAHLVGNSMGGRIALTAAVRFPDMVSSLTLMGVRGPESEAGFANLRRVRAYEPSQDDMRDVLSLFTYDPASLSEDLVRTRYEASIVPGAQESYRRMFESGVANLLPVTTSELQSLAAPTLIFHGREDRVIPVECAYELAGSIPDVVAVVASRCGHWVQIDRRSLFESQLESFLLEHSSKFLATGGPGRGAR